MRARPSTLLVLVGLPLALGAAPGCGKQGEGERCDLAGSASDDCETGLECVSPDLLAGDLNGTGVCCPPIGQPITDHQKCDRSSGFPTGGTSGVDGAIEGAAGAADDAAESAASCNYNSDCLDGQVCGPLGHCQIECVTDRDCESPKVCVSGTCTLSESGTSSATDSSIDSGADSSIDSGADSSIDSGADSSIDSSAE